MVMTCARVRELASGFVLGALEPDEMIAVQDHLDGCAEPHPEVDELGGVLPYIAQSLAPVEPPAWLRESVIEAAKADLAGSRRMAMATTSAPAGAVNATPAPQLAAVARSSRTRVVPFSAFAARHRRALAWTSRAAAALLVVSLAGYAFVVQNDLNTARSQPTANPYGVIGPNTRVAKLSPSDASSQAAGLAVLQPSGHVFVQVNHLDATSGDQVYMVWVTADHGVTSKIGWFTVDSSGTAQMDFTNVPNSASLWLFICKEPNSNVATPGVVYLGGTISL
jgi:hypothetical protein